MTTQDAEKSTDIVLGTLNICLKKTRVVFDLGSTHSFVDIRRARSLNLPAQLLDVELVVRLLIGESMIIDHVYRGCEVKINGYDFPTNLLSFNLLDFEVILGLDWLTRYKVGLNCDKKLVKLVSLNKFKVCFQGDKVKKSKFLIFAMEAHKLLRKGCIGYLAYMVNSERVDPSIEDIPVVQEFLVVFPEELLGLPPERKVEFGFKLLPKT